MTEKGTFDSLKTVFMRQVVLVIVVNALVKPVYLLGIERAVQNKVGTEMYGLFFVLFNFIYLFQVFNDLGIQQYNNRFIAQNRHLIGKYFSKIFNLKVVLTLGFMVIATAVGFYFGYVQKYPWLFTIVMVNHAMNAFFLYLRSNVSGLGLYSRDSLLTALDKLILIFLCLGLFWYSGNGFTIYHFALAQTASIVLSSLWALWLLRKQVDIGVSKLSGKEMRVLLRQSIPFGLVILLGTIHTRIDAVMIDNLLTDGKYQSGVYAAAYRILNAFNMAGFLIAGLLFPMFSRALRQMMPLDGIIRAGASILGWISVTAAILFYFFGTEISNYLYTESTDDWGVVLSVLMLTIVPHALDYLYGSLLSADGRLRFINIVLVITIAMNVSLNLWMIPQYGSLGAAITTIISQTVVGVVFAWKCHHNILTKNFFTYWWRIIVYGIALVFIVILIRQTGMGFIASVASCSLLSILAAFLLRIIRVNEIMELNTFSDKKE